MDEKKKVVIIISRGFDDERASVAWSVANGALNNGLELTIFLVSSGIDWVRKGAAEGAHLNPHDPTMKQMIDNVFAAGCKVYACPPCAKSRMYTEADFIDGVEIQGSTVVHQAILAGAETISF